MSGTGNLSTTHLQDLRRSGLSDETIAAMSVYTEESHAAVGAILQRRWTKRRGTSLVFPFRDHEGNANGYRRVRPDCPRTRDGKPIKYESPQGSTNRAYFPPGVAEVLSETSVELLVTEGEKKSAKATQEGFPCIGLVGVFGWKDGKGSDRLIPDLECVEWRGRQVRIVFDSDREEKEGIQDAEARLAQQLTRRGAVVRVVALPHGDDGAKVGVDDFLVSHSPLELRKLLDDADDPAPVSDAVMKTPARLLDAMPEAEGFLARLQKSGNILRRLNGSWYGFDEKRYQFISDDYLRAQLIQHLHPIASHLTAGAVGNIESAIKAKAELPAATAFNTWIGGGQRDRNLLAVQNGIVDIDALLADREPALISHSPDWFSTVCLPYEFNPTAPCDRWEDFLHEVQDGNGDCIDILQEFFGLCLVRDTSFQKFLMLEGEGANGKSVAMTVLRAMLGTENVSHVPLEFFGDKFRLISTLGKLANIVAEVGELDRVAEGFLKSFTAGDSMQFEQKFKPTVDAVPTARLALSANNRPRFSDRSGGLWRRMILIPFGVTIPVERQIRGMATAEWWREQGELPGILSWSLQGLLRLKDQGRFTESQTVTDAVDDYRRESNPARTFLQENYHANPTGWTPAEDVYSEYRQWCETNGYRPLAAATFGKEIRRVFPAAKRTRTRDGGSRTWGYSGINSAAVVGGGPSWSQ